MHNTQQSHNHRLARMEADQHRRVLEVASFVSATLGEDFFRSVVQHLSSALGVDCVYLAELTGTPLPRLKTVAACRDQQFVPNFEQDLPGTAASQVLEDGAVSFSADAGRIFPLDPLLTFGAEGYVGMRLCDSTARPMGLIAVVTRERLLDAPLVNSVLRTFAVRAAAELERTRAYEALQESEERYRAFVSSSLDAMWRIEFSKPIPLEIPHEDQIECIYRDGYLAECNDAMARLVGANSAEQLVGTPFGNLFSRTDDRVYEELRSFVRSGYGAATVQTMPLDGEGKPLYRLRTQCGICMNNHLLRIWGTTRDITELKRAELAFEASERRFREVLENIQLPALMLDLRGEITFCNARSVRLMGLSKRELIGANWLELAGSASERESWEALLSGRDNGHIESVVQLPKGGSRLIAWDTTLLRDEAGAIAGLAAIGRED